VLSRPHLAQIPSQLDEAGVPLCLFLFFPSQDLVDLGQNKEGTLAIELRRHRHRPKTKVRQTDQDRLLACARDRPQPGRACRGRARGRGKWCMDSVESGCRYVAETVRTRSVELCHRLGLRIPAAARQKWWPGGTELRLGACGRK